MASIATTSINDGIGHLVIDSPPVNALSQPVRQAIVDGVAKLAADPAVNAIVLSCAGRTFFAGADISELGRPFEAPDLTDVVEALEDAGKLAVAAIHGTALGGGLEVASGAHYRVALASAMLGFPEVLLGLIPGAGGTQRAPRLIDAGKALDLITSGKPLPAKAAFELGLVDRAVDGEDPAAAGEAYARELLAAGTPVRKVRDLPVRIGDETALRQMMADLSGPRALDAVRGACEAVAVALHTPFMQGIVEERRIFERLMAGAQSRALRYMFFAEREAGKLAGISASAKPLPVATVGVVGAGTMGSGIAMCFLNAGIPVTLVEVKQEALERGVANIRKTYEALVARGRLNPQKAESTLSLLNSTLDFTALGKDDLVIEAVFESMPVKKEIFGRLAAIAKPGALMASNTSFLSIDEIASATTGREGDLLGLHFFSPANIMPLLEVVRGAKTSDAALATAMQIARKLGKIAVVSRVGYGFVANRVMDARRVEAERLLLEGNSVHTIDKVLCDYGFPMGQFQMFDLVGLDVMGRDSDVRTLMGDFVKAGRLGQKQGGGFYNYDADRKATFSPEAETIVQQFAASQAVTRVETSNADLLKRLIYPVVNEAALLLDEGIVQRASDIDVAVMAGYGWPRHTGGPVFWGDEQGLPEIARVLEGMGIKVAESIRQSIASGSPLHMFVPAQGDAGKGRAARA